MPNKSTSASAAVKARPRATGARSGRAKPKESKEPAPAKDMGWLLDLRAAKEALESALSAPSIGAAPLAAAIEAGKAAIGAGKPAAASLQVDVFGEVLKLLERAATEQDILRLEPGSAWRIPTEWLQKALDRAVEHGKTPLVVDNDAGVAANYLKYQSVVTVDGKGLVVRKATKSASLQELQGECREKLVTAMTSGYPLLLDCGKAAPDFLGTFCDESSFPVSVFPTVHHDAFNGKDDAGYMGSAVNCGAFDHQLADGDKLRELQSARAVGRVRGCHTIVLTAFEFDDFGEFMRFDEFLPARDTFQVINVLPNS